MAAYIEENTLGTVMRIAMAFAFCILGACSDKEHSTAPLVPPQSMVVAAPSPTTASTVSQTSPRELTELEKQEPGEIAKSENLVDRKGKTLSLHLLSGKVLELSNLETCDIYENCLFYTYRGLVADKQFFLVNAAYYEGGSVLLISRKTGEQVDAISEPHVSPDGRFIVSASDADAHADAGVFLWEISEGALISQFHFVPTDYQLYKFIRWIDPNKVELLKTVWPPKDLCPENTLAEYSMALVAKNRAWALEAASDKGKCLTKQ